MIHGPKRSGNYVPGPGRPKGSSTTRYITINSMIDAIQKALGCTFQEAYAELLLESREAYYDKSDLKTYPRMMEAAANKFVEQAKTQPDDTPSTEEMTDEELEARAKELAAKVLEKP